jgi:dynein cytoplasmic 1 intermediate chain
VSEGTWIDSNGTTTEAQQQELERLKEEWLREKEEELRSKMETVTLEPADTNGTAQKMPIRTLDGEELDTVVTSHDFREFLEKSSKIADRALDEPYDILVDYAQGSGLLDEDEDFGKGRTRRGRRIKQVSQYWDEKWSRKRMISDIGFSPKVSIFSPVLMS